MTSAQIDLVLDRLETISQVLHKVQLFTAVKISHAEFKLHSRKAIKSKDWYVWICMDMY